MSVWLTREFSLGTREGARAAPCYFRAAGSQQREADPGTSGPYWRGVRRQSCDGHFEINQA